MSNIEWTDATWNPVIGCTPVSPGCLNCYAATMARRLEAIGVDAYLARVDEAPRVVRIAEVKNGRAVFTGEVRTLEERLTEPLSWRKPRRVFVNSMSDLFHESVPFAFIDKVFAVMALCPQHTFQVLTKRPERMAEYLRKRTDGGLKLAAAMRDLVGRSRSNEFVSRTEEAVRRYDNADGVLPNVWLGTSVEDQARADERIPHLLRCPAAVRFLSCEPLLGAVDLSGCMTPAREIMGLGGPYIAGPDAGVHWVIVGGESGGGVRACDVEWIRSIVGQCKASGVPCFVKQLGARFYDAPNGIAGAALDIPPEGMKLLSYRLRDRKGGDPAEWPKDLRVREWPGEGKPQIANEQMSK